MRALGSSRMAHAYWPLFDITVRTPRLELRYPDDATLFELTAVVAQGIHDPEYMPFMLPWTRASSPQLERGALAHWWGRRASWQPRQLALHGCRLRRRETGGRAGSPCREVRGHQ